MKEDIIVKVGYDFKFNQSACYSCKGKCCIGASGYIWINYDEIAEVSNFLNLTIEEFSFRYLKKVKYKYSIREKKLSKNNFACIFFDLEKKRCQIYNVRPSQCRTYPFWEENRGVLDSKSIAELKSECPGIIF